MQLVFNLGELNPMRHKNASKKTKQREESPLWLLDDSQPAGPYQQKIDEMGLRLICLATIRQAVLDERSSRKPDVVQHARQFLAGPARDWLRAMRIHRTGENMRIFNLIYKSSAGDFVSLIEEIDLDGGCYDLSEENKK